MKRFTVEAKNLNFKPVTLMNEEGTRNITGILFKMIPGDDLYYRVVTFYHDVLWLVDEHMMRQGDRLRATQPTEFFDQLSKDKAAEHPAVPLKNHPFGFASSLAQAERQERQRE